MATESVETGNVDQASEATPVESPAAMRSEDYVTPELENAFKRVFEGKGDDEPAEDKASAREEKSTPRGSRKQQAAREQDEELAEQSAKQSKSKKPAAAADDDDTASDDGPAEDEPAKGKKKAPAQAEKDAAEDEGGDAEDELEPALRRDAQRNGWTDDEIDELHAANPELARKTFANLRKANNELSSRFAQLGLRRSAPQQQQQAPSQPQRQAPGQQQQQQRTPSLDDLYANLEEFGENNGKDFVEKFLVPFKSELDQFRQARDYYLAQQQDSLRTEVSLAFKGLDGADELYGKAAPETEEHYRNRQHVARVADQIHAGAQDQGVKMSYTEAIERAHALATTDRVAERERKKLIGQVQRRSNSVVTRPSQRKGNLTAAEGGNRSERAAMEAYAHRAAELGITVD